MIFVTYFQVSCLFEAAWGCLQTFHENCQNCFFSRFPDQPSYESFEETIWASPMLCIASWLHILWITNRMVETCWNPISSGMFTTVFNWYNISQPSTVCHVPRNLSWNIWKMVNDWVYHVSMTIGYPQRYTLPASYPLVNQHNYGNLWKITIFQWVNQLWMATFDSYVKLPAR